MKTRKQLDALTDLWRGVDPKRIDATRTEMRYVVARAHWLTNVERGSPAAEDDELAMERCWRHIREAQ